MGRAKNPVTGLGVVRLARSGRLLFPGEPFRSATGRPIEPSQRGVVQIDRAQPRGSGTRDIGGRLQNIELRSESRGKITSGESE